MYFTTINTNIYAKKWLRADLRDSEIKKDIYCLVLMMNDCAHFIINVQKSFGTQYQQASKRYEQSSK